MPPMQWTWHDVILDIRRDDVRVVWWHREAAQQTPAKLFVEQTNEPRRTAGDKWDVQEVLVGNWQTTPWEFYLDVRYMISIASLSPLIHSTIITRLLYFFGQILLVFVGFSPP